MSETIEIYWEDGRGKTVTREVNQTIDVAAFLGTAGYSSLIVAANTHLSVADIYRFLQMQARETPGVARSRGWIQRRRWSFQQPGTVNPVAKPNSDGNDARAFKLMGDHLTLSLYSLTKLLKEHGITRSREWVRMHRCDAVCHN